MKTQPSVQTHAGGTINNFLRWDTHRCTQMFICWVHFFCLFGKIAGCFNKPQPHRTGGAAVRFEVVLEFGVTDKEVEPGSKMLRYETPCGGHK